MKFNRFIIQHIFETKFKDALNKKIAQDITRLDCEDLEVDFGEKSDIFELDYIDRIDVDNYEIEQDDDETLVSGEMEINAEINGFTYDHGEAFAAGSSLITLGYLFSFTENENEVSNLYLENIY